MGARYGRNQRRAHRARIAELTAALEGGWPQARDFDALETLVPSRVISWIDTESYFYEMGFVRHAEVTYRLPDPLSLPLLRSWERDGRIAWKGIAWRIKGLRADEQAMGIVARLDLETRNRRRP